MPETADTLKRSTIYASIADQLGATCNSMIADDGGQLVDEADGKMWDGTIFYCIGELVRVRGADPSQIQGRDYTAIARGCLGRWQEVDTLRGCFAAMGLAMLGKADGEHPVLGKLPDEVAARVEETLRVTKEFPHNWEVFNASMRMGRSVLWGDDPALCLPHLKKMTAKYAESGYFDDSASSGDYNNYGLMTINFALRLSEFLPEGHDVRTKIEDMFRPHAKRYFELLQLFIGRRGEGWFFGRSSGVLGQLQCLSYLEQLIAKQWLSAEDAAWARRACRELTGYMVDVFWDEDRQWFSFRDAHRTCYSYRATVPMSWDLWRYFLQLEHYAKLDEAAVGQELSVLPADPICREVITNADRHTAYLVWSDGDIKWQMPIMGGPTCMSGDNLPRPYLPGLFEWTTGPHPAPVLCPRFVQGETHGWPAWWPSSTELSREADSWRYRVRYSKLCGAHGEALDWPVSATVEYRFGPGFFERLDQFEVSKATHFDELRIEALQGMPHPKSRAYPKVFAINFAMQSNIDGATVTEDDVSADPFYRNYYSHAVKRVSLTRKDFTLERGEYTLKTTLRWDQ